MNKWLIPVYYGCWLWVSSLSAAHPYNLDEINYQFRLPYKFNKSTSTGLYNAVIHSFKYVGCGGYIRAGYIQTDIDTQDKEQAYGLGGNLLCGFKWDDSLNFQLGLFASINPGFNSHNIDLVQGDFFNGNKNSYFLLGEAALNYTLGKFQMHLGRQRFDSPHMDQDDLRLVPNLFEAYLLDYHPSSSLYAGGGLVRSAAGWENGGNAAEFIDIAEALGGAGDQAWVAWVRYQQKHWSGNAWVYHIVDNVDIIYGEWLYNRQLNESLTLNLGLQFDLGRDSGTARMGSIEANTWGIMANLSWHDFTFTAAYNRNHGKSGALSSVGGGPFFTSMEDQTLDAISPGDDAEALLLGLEYQPLPDLLIGVAAGEFRSQNTDIYHKQEFNAYLSYQWQETIRLDFMFAQVNDKNSAQDKTQFRVILNYQF